MSRAVFGCLVVTALAIALASRLVGSDLRPMHHDEANQAVKFGMLLETGEYRYDLNDHHGPTLYYMTLPAAWARGQTTLAALDERTLRAVPAIFGVGLIFLFLPLVGGLGRPAVAASALLAALSPVLTYYSRFYIQESLFVFFALAFLIALGRFAQRPAAGWAVWAGGLAGLAYSTKETSAIVLPAAVAAAILARVTTRVAEAGGEAVPPIATRRRAVFVAAGLAAAILVAFVFYSSLFRYPAGLLESIRAFGIYFDRGVGVGPHAQPFDYYIRLLSFSSSGGLVWTEGLVLVLALAGMIATVPATSRAVGLKARSRAEPHAGLEASAVFWPRYIGLYSLIAFVAFSAVRYKTPWNLLPFYAGFVLMAGVGAAALIEGAASRVARGLVVVVLLLATSHLAMQNWRANVRYAADPRNPYVYAQTVPDFLRLVQRVTGVAAIHPDRSGMLVKVLAGPYEQWPLPWYLRRMTRVGYWSRAADAGRLDDAPVIVASGEQTEAVSAALGDRYVQEFYGLRPDVLLAVYIERTLWDRFLVSRPAH
jgi:uncharacterized protein (TIGR03663 family)